ncbi:disease resistance protein TAO1-like [Durio zibethinus]|uniref:Disease resistance protein TAO1-like n=1 Tax=Durio zibethinus TaxID=66656 RepID=A0A6P5X1R2_DURZI|nr:disease resistance protein TAO1-like [Durio zibethinus]
MVRRKAKSSHFSFTRRVGIVRCDKLSGVPVMTRFSSLEILTVRAREELSLIGDGLFPSNLKKLEIQEGRKLSSIPSVEGSIFFLQEHQVEGCHELSKIEEGLVASTCLRDVCTRGCPKLIFINSGSESFLKRLELRRCYELREIGGLSSSTMLEKLLINDCPNLISIPSVNGCSFFLSLSLDGCDGLISLPSGLRAQHSLGKPWLSHPFEDIGIGSLFRRARGIPRSHEFHLFPGRFHLTGKEKTNLSVRSTSTPHSTQQIIDSKLQQALPEWFGNFSSLRSLHITYCENLEHLPSKEAMQHLSNLKKLELRPYSEQLEQFPVPMRSISSLEDLALHGWKKLCCLTDQLQHLTALGQLSIRNFGGVSALPVWLGTSPLFDL